MIAILSALSLGFIGSLHCAGMCGPIALALPLKNKNYFTRITSTLIYNSGRIITYAILGLIFGLIGEGINLGGFQRFISIATGVILILSVITPYIFKKKFSFFHIPFFEKIKIKLGNLFSSPTFLSVFFIGVLNGLLPCGLVYIAVAIAISTSDIFQSMLVMIAFGIATTPMLVTLSLIGNILSGNLKKSISKILPYLIVFIGILFILRGLNLGIKYISPEYDLLKPHTEVKCCCKK